MIGELKAMTSPNRTPHERIRELLEANNREVERRRRLAAEVNALHDRVRCLELELCEVEQRLGAALGYPKKPCPSCSGAGEHERAAGLTVEYSPCHHCKGTGQDPGGRVCVGERVPGTLAAEAAEHIMKIGAERDAAVEMLKSIKSKLMHFRLFGDPLRGGPTPAGNTLVQVEGDVEEWLVQHGYLASEDEAEPDAAPEP